MKENERSEVKERAGERSRRRSMLERSEGGLCHVWRGHTTGRLHGSAVLSVRLYRLWRTASTRIHFTKDKTTLNAAYRMTPNSNHLINRSLHASG
jgi:hypothetical protein